MTKKVHKMIFKRDILENYVAKFSNERRRIDPDNMSYDEAVDAAIQEMKKQGLEGWRWKEVFLKFGSYLLVNDGKYYEYAVIDGSTLDRGAMTRSDSLENLINSLNEVGEEGWEYCTSIYFKDPDDRLKVILYREITATKAKKRKQEKEDRSLLEQLEEDRKDEIIVESHKNVKKEVKSKVI